LQKGDLDPKRQMGPYETVAADVHVGSEIQRAPASDEEDDDEDDSSGSVVENDVSPMRLLDQPPSRAKAPMMSAATAAGVDISINSQLSRTSSSPSEPGE